VYGIIGQLTARPGTRDELVGILSGVAGRMAGCLSYVIAEDPDDESALWVTEIWESEEAHANSLSDPAVRAAIEQGKPLIAGMGERIVTRPVGGVNRPLP
jgi:quinol monooxygenase YgiN